MFVNWAVVNPVVYTLNSNSQITDPLSAAGGVTGETTLDGVNPALRVIDEAEYYAPRLGETPPACLEVMEASGVSIGPRVLDDADHVLVRDANDQATPCVQLSGKSCCPGSSLQF